MRHHAASCLLAIALAGFPFVTAWAQEQTPPPVSGTRPLSLRSQRRI